MATVGRKPRKTKFKPKSGRATVTVKPHKRSPRGKNSGKSRPRIRAYRRNAPR